MKTDDEPDAGFVIWFAITILLVRFDWINEDSSVENEDSSLQKWWCLGRSGDLDCPRDRPCAVGPSRQAGGAEQGARRSCYPRSVRRTDRWVKNDEFVLKLMDFALNMMDVALNMKHFALKMMYCALKMMYFALKMM